MKTTSNIDFRTRAARSATLDYCRKADLFALAAKAGSVTHFLLYENEELIQQVADELNRINFLGKQWRRCADEQWEGGYTPDIVSLDGEVTIEVKGFGGTFSSLKWGE